MKLLLDSLWLFGVYVQVVYAEADGTKTASLMDKDPNTHKTDLQTPEIIREYNKPCSSKGSSSNCVLLCSVTNAPDATLTMYKDNTVFSMIKYADLNFDLSLCLEVENQDNSSYSCVINNPISYKTTDLNIRQLCQDCKDIPVSVMEGDSVTLHTNITEVQMKDQLVWMFECLGHGQLTGIAEILNKAAEVNDCVKLRSRDRLQLDNKTGDLTIKNTSKEDSGVYKLLINSPDSTCWSFNVSVHAHLPVPVITNNSLQCSSSSSGNCSLVCYAVNVSDVTLSWYKGISVLSSISVSDHNNSISLCLEVDYQDKNTYSCVIYNPITHQTTHLDINELCPVPSNDHILEYVVAPAVASVAAVLIGAIVGFCFYKRNQARQQVAAGGDPPERNPDENDALIPSSSSVRSYSINIAESVC